MALSFELRRMGLSSRIQRLTISDEIGKNPFVLGGRVIFQSASVPLADNADGDKWCESRDLIRSYQFRRHNGRSSPPLPRRHSDYRNSCWDHCASDPRSNAPTSWLHRALPGIPRMDTLCPTTIDMPHLCGRCPRAPQASREYRENRWTDAHDLPRFCLPASWPPRCAVCPARDSSSGQGHNRSEYLQVYR